MSSKSSTINHIFEKKIGKYFLAFSKQYADALLKKRQQTKNSPRIDLDENWASEVYSKYNKYKEKYINCFNPDSNVKLDEHKVIAILMASVLEVGIDRKRIQGMYSELIDSRFTVYIMIRFLKVYYEELAKEELKEEELAKKKLIKEEFAKIFKEKKYYKVKKILFPKSMNGDQYHLQLIKSLHYSKEKDNDFNILLLSNIVFFIDNFNHTILATRLLY